MPLLTPECVKGLPIFDQFSAIYCALLDVDTSCTTPTLVSATIDAGVLTLVFSETVTGHDGFVLEIDGVAAVLTYVSGEGTDTLVFSTVPDASVGDEVILNYVPGDVANGDCLLEAIEEFFVTNNTGLDNFRVTSGGDFRVTSGADSRVTT